MLPDTFGDEGDGSRFPVPVMGVGTGPAREQTVPPCSSRGHGTGRKSPASSIIARAPQGLCRHQLCRNTESMLEATLFGHERRVYGRTGGIPGKFEQAQGGAPAKFPNASLQSVAVGAPGVMERLGSKTTIPLDVRILASTNRDLEGEVSKGFPTGPVLPYSVFP
jgi:two-component system response regulator FlrC